MWLQDGPDEPVEMWADALRVLDEIVGGVVFDHESGFLGKVVGDELALLPGVDILADELELSVIDANAFFGTLDPDGGAHISVWQAVKTVLELDKLIEMDFGLFPGGQFKGLDGQGLEGWFFYGFKELQRFLSGDAMAFEAVVLEAPGPDGLIGVLQVQVGLDGFKFPKSFAHDGDTAFDFAFIFGFPGPSRIDKKVVVIGKFHQQTIERRHVQIGLDYPGFEVIDDQPLWDAAKEFQHGNEGSRKTFLVLFIHKLDKFQAAVAAHGNKGVHVSIPLRDRIEQAAHFGIIDLHFFARLGFKETGTWGLICQDVRKMVPDKALK